MPTPIEINNPELTYCKKHDFHCRCKKCEQKYDCEYFEDSTTEECVSVNCQGPNDKYIDDKGIAICFKTLMGEYKCQK